eukprot:scaffold10372_cov243-Ochromonas_danica.AAC.4
MDSELLLSLLVLWSATTTALVTFFRLWFSNGGESFHPHSVDVEQRHGLFLVVQSQTECKLDCPVKSISTFVAPRGSSGSKHFTVLCVVISVAGMLGCQRWNHVGDATFLEASLSFVGFAALMLVAAFELDVVPERFLEDKLIVTGWLIEKLNLDKALPFKLSPWEPAFREFIRESSGIYHLYEEDFYLQQRSAQYQVWNYQAVWPMLHMLGAMTYVFLLPTAIILNDRAEEKVGYLTGNYVPVLKCFRGWILLWNPFLREPHFMGKLKQAVLDYQKRHSNASSNGKIEDRKGLRKRRKEKNSKAVIDSVPEPKKMEIVDYEEADKALDSVFLRFARNHPELYLKIVGHLNVMSELIALLTPSVAMGLQWVTALCDGPPLLSIIDLILLGVDCIKDGQCPSDYDTTYLSYCILKS